MTLLEINYPIADRLLLSFSLQVVQLRVSVLVLLPLAHVMVRLDLRASGHTRDYTHRVENQRDFLIVVKALHACA